MSENNTKNGINTRNGTINNKPPPPFYGNVMPDKISLTMDDGDEEVTRRVGGTPLFNSSFNNSIGNFASTSIFASPSTSINRSAFGGDSSSSFGTVARKSNQQVASAQQYERDQKIFCWNLYKVPSLPEFHPLERTAVFVPYSFPSKISVRISDVLRDRSIQAKYDNEKAKVSCVTSNGVDFRIRLYRGRNQYNHGIIIEIQRRFGTSFSFHRDIKAILDAAEGKKKTAATPSPPNSRHPITSNSNNDSYSLPNATEEEGHDYDTFKPKPNSSLKMVRKMLLSRSGGYDTKYLAMQILITSTDPKKVGLMTAKSIAKEIILPGNDVGATVAEMILSPMKEEDSFGLNIMAITVLSNVFGMISGDIPDHLKLALLPVLSKSLRNADKNPRMAHIAAKCIEHIIGNGVESSTEGDLIREALEVASKVGNAKHIGLMHQTEVCLQKIMS